MILRNWKSCSSPNGNVLRLPRSSIFWSKIGSRKKSSTAKPLRWVLDKGDTIAKRRMAQKMKFLAEVVVAIPLLTLRIERSNGVIFGTFSVINLFREWPNPT